MFQWRLKLREARQAIAAGRVEEARRVLNDAELQGFLPAKQLAGKLAQKYAERAQRRIAWGESSAGLADLDAAADVGGDAEHHEAIRNEYRQRVLDDVIAKLAAGDLDAALKRLDRTRRRGVATQALRDAEGLAQLWRGARELADTGEMGPALEKFARVERLAGTLPSIQAAGGGTLTLTEAIAVEWRSLSRRSKDHQAARERMHAAAAARRWDDALCAVEGSLRVAPADTVALALRKRLWRELGLSLTRSDRDSPVLGSGHEPHQSNPGKTPLAMPKDYPNEKPEKRPGSGRGRRLAQSLRREGARDSGAVGDSTSPSKPSAGPSKPSAGATSVTGPHADRRMLWVDAVGGYLVCLDDEVVLGQPTGAAGGPAIPILADVSRRHAVIRREGGAYVLEPIGAVTLDGAPVTGPTVLADKHDIGLGAAVCIRFTRPHALSVTARLEVVSGHRLTASADAVLLMGESCVMGPNRHSHVRCKHWKDDVILFRQGGKLMCRSRAAMTLNGQASDGPAVIRPASRIEGEDFALSVELA
ncbi:MAG: FHA domain-containing protein [Planctomycetota bacterium]